MKLLGVEGVRSGMQQVKGAANDVGNTLNSVFATGGKFGLGLFGAGTALQLLRNEIRHVAEDIGNIPGIPESTVESINRAKFEFSRMRAEADGFLAKAMGKGWSAAQWIGQRYADMQYGIGTGAALAALNEADWQKFKEATAEQKQQAADAAFMAKAWKQIAEEQKKSIAVMLDYAKNVDKLSDLRRQADQIGETPSQKADRLRAEANTLYQRSTGEAPEIAIKTQVEAQQKLNEARQIEHELEQRGAALGRDQVRYSQERLSFQERLLRIQTEIHEIERAGAEIDLSTATGTEDAIKREERLLALKKERDQLTRDAARQGPASGDFGGQIGRQVDDLFARWGTLAQQTGQLIAGTIGTAVEGVNYSIARAVVYTGNFKQGFLEVAQTISFQVVQAIVGMFTTWIAQRAVAAVKNMFFSTQEGAADAAAKAPGAALTSISSFGVAAAVGIAALTAAMAAFGGFAGGGYTGDMGRGQIAGVVHGQEYVLPADFVSAIGRSNLDRAVYAGGYVASTSKPGAGSGAFGRDARGTSVAFFDDRTTLRQWLRSQEGTRAIVQVINDSRGELLT
jgi:hypothetical protein